MSKYERLLKQTPILLREDADLPEPIKGLYMETRAVQAILLSRSLRTSADKACILAEELGHYHTTAGDITDQSIIANRKQEKLARNWGYEKLVPLSELIGAYLAGCRNAFEIADYLEVTEAFLQESIVHYQEKYGQMVVLDRFTLYFDPLGVVEMFER
ncbi:ImmA/IrrE family metallo-endopeptidase [Paenibacillus sp. B01]|uniref:ImmA/IrrE family metallo-endopeptidase n=1 Tax=Paenibacillus sp. B01 TaxID=2660554 RepID=UPI00129B8AFB|nr:ImmA/IrrE family metallo-endopeptidase [Paenibacillus sp. B01]QGG57422.1 ImmA/IrrE family metallo-endopeptidase [Paenibacillus sp. B01]